ncbi:hypothetical protein [Rudaea sp.]
MNAPTTKNQEKRGEKMDDVLKRMLGTPPQPRDKKPEHPKKKAAK